MSVSAVLSGQTDIAVGNVVGSNIFNVLFILGIAALIIPLRVDAQIIRQEVPMMIAASALLLFFVLDQQVSLFESVFLFVLLIGYTIFLVMQSRRQSALVQSEYASELKPAEQFEDIASINRYDMIARGFTHFVYFDAELVRFYRLRKPGQPLGDLFPEIIEVSSKLQKKPSRAGPPSIAQADMSATPLKPSRSGVGAQSLSLP